MNTDILVEKKKKSYLDANYKFFAIKDTTTPAIDYHYHDFDKIIFFISGKVNYHIEGKIYKLKPWDILLIKHNTIHSLSINPSTPYQRFILWLKPDFFSQHNIMPLYNCFDISIKNNFNLIRFSNDELPVIKSIIQQLSAQQENIFAQEILQTALITQILVHLNRSCLTPIESTTDVEYDQVICDILSYLNNNISEDLNVDKISTIFYLSKAHLMRKFKKHTGYSIHNYILQKRLYKASQLIKDGDNITTAALNCGFNDYSSFSRAFKKMHHLSPKEFQQKNR